MYKTNNTSSIFTSVLILLLFVFFAPDSYAQNTGTNQNITYEITQLLNVIISFLSWFWIWLASFAGKLMTNGLVYGEFIGLDKTLYYLRNLTRTFANFLIVGLLLFEVGQGLLSKKGDLRAVIKKAGKLFVGVLLINASWFIIGATVDMSTLLTTTAASLSNSYIASENSQLKDTMKHSIMVSHASYTKNISLNENLSSNQKLVDTQIKEDADDPNGSNEVDMRAMLDTLLPSETSISGPLLYLGIGVFQLDNFFDNTLSNDQITNNIFVLSVRLAIVVSYVFVLVLLIIVNIARIIAIWFAVAFGPLLIILRLSGNEKWLGTTGEKLGRQSILRAIFAPVLAVSLLSIGLIVIVMLQKYFQPSKSIEREETYIQSNGSGSSMGVDNILNIRIDGDILGRTDGQQTQNFFSQIFMILFTLFIIFGIAKIIAKFLEKGFGGGVVKSASELTQQALGTLPVIPTPYGPIGTTSASRALKELPKRTFGKKGISNDIKTENFFRKIAGLPLKPDPLLARQLEKFKKEIQSTSRIGSTQFNKLQSLVSDYIQESNYNQHTTSIAGISNVSGTLQTFFKTLATQKTDLSTLGAFRSGHLVRDDDTKTVEEFVKKNYTKHQDFFRAVYDSVGGNSGKLHAD